VTIAIVRAALVVVALAVWEITARIGSPLLYVPPSAALPALRDLLLLRSYPDLPAHLLLTVREILVAYGLAVAAGLAVGFALGLYRTMGRAY
jgi:NitT/TauT family transport system permease protein